MPDNAEALDRPSAGLGSRALRNTILILGARVISRLITLVTVVAINKHLLAARFGDFSTVNAVEALVVPIALDFGFNILYQREGARHPKELERYLQNLMSARVFVSVFAVLIVWVALDPLALTQYTLPAVVTMILASYSNLMRNTLYALQRLNWEAAGIVIESALLLGLTIAGIYTHQGVAYFLWAYAASYAFDCVYFAVLLRVKNIVRFGWRLEMDFLRKWFWMGIPFTVIFVLTTVYWKVDVPILQFFRGSTEVGWYSIAYKPFESLLFVPITMLGVAFPVLAVYHTESQEKLRTAVTAFIKALVILGWPLSVGVFLMAAPLGALVPGFYPQSAPALQVLALAYVFGFVNNAFIGALTAMDRQGTFAKAAGIAVMVNIVLNLILIPQFGFMAAAWNTVATEIVLTGVGYWLTARHLGGLPLGSTVWRPILAGLVMGAVLFPFRDVRGYAVVVVVAVAIAVYFAAVMALRTIDKDEMAFVRSAIRRRS